jgi:ectoine hydroxylase-related dioxygenase (phytanoyl-CoA dioxygenase family)
MLVSTAKSRFRVAISFASVGGAIQKPVSRFCVPTFKILSMSDVEVVNVQLDSDGYAVREGILTEPEIDKLIGALERQQEGERLHRNGKVFAVRNLLDLPEISELAQAANVRELAKAVLGEKAFAVRGILFDKIPEANWKVPWHQDVTIAVRAREDVAGFGPWSTKAGILHVQPPAQVLESMISIRLHLDACDESNGALHVIPGSHRAGRIAATEIPPMLAKSQAHACVVGRGGALLMRPLLLHASSPSQAPAHRRVIHLDFASERLPFPMRWLSEPDIAAKPGTCGATIGHRELL